MTRSKKLMSLLLVLCLVVGMLPMGAFAATTPSTYSDVKSEDWFADAVQYVTDKNLMNGTGNGKFSPTAETSRAMLVTMLYRMEGNPQTEMPTFSDVSAGKWYSDAIGWAQENAIVDGVGGNRFAPNVPITREQFATILYRYSAYKEYDTSETSSILSYDDGAKVSSWATHAMAWATGSKMLEGIGNNKLAPQGLALRSQAATIMMRYDKKYNMPEPTPSPTATPEATVAPTATPEVTPSPKPVEKFTVTFDLNYNSSGDTIKTSVESGASVAAPATPMRSGYSFRGWYTSKTGSDKFDFTSKITSDITLYAHWSPVISGGGGSGGSSGGGGHTPPSTKYYTVTFDANNGRDNSIFQIQNLNAGGTVAEPTEGPTRELYRFTGWYLEPATVTEYDFSTPVVSNLTLYAGWGNPDGSDDGLYAASNETETIYSITGIDVIDNEVIVTYNTNSQCLMAVEFFEDQMTGSDWSEAAQLANLSTTPISTTSGYTSTYGEMITLALPIEGTLPEHFVVRATLYGTGEAKDPTYVTNQYTATYETFDAQTVDSVTEEYGEDLVINFDNDRTTNFGVLKDIMVPPSRPFPQKNA